MGVFFHRRACVGGGGGLQGGMGGGEAEAELWGCRVCLRPLTWGGLPGGWVGGGGWTCRAALAAERRRRPSRAASRRPHCEEGGVKGVREGEQGREI